MVFNPKLFFKTLKTTIFIFKLPDSFENVHNTEQIMFCQTVENPTIFRQNGTKRVGFFS
jgi:hypothetical protein